MNKKGFTLIELIATIVIIILMGLIVTPKVIDIINDNRIKGYKEIEARLEEAAAKYVSDNYVDSNESYIIIQKEQLIDGKYIGEIYDLKDHSVCDAYVTVSNLNGIVEFDAILSCPSYLTDTVTLTVNLDEGNTKQQFLDSYKSGTEIRLEEPIKTGYLFEEWFVTSGDSSIKGNVLKIGKNDTTIVATYKDSKTILTVDLDGGTTTQTFASSYVEGATIELETPTKTGYTFNKWEIVNGNSTIDGSSFTIGSKNTTIRAKWTANTYAITYNLDGGIKGMNAPTEGIFGSTIPIDNPTRTGYTFTGWSVTGTGAIISGTNLTIGSSDITLTANWTVNTYTITYNLVGGTKGTNAPTSGTYGSTVIVDNPTRSGYTFNGWTVSGTGASMSGTSLTIGTGNITLTANWTANTYTISYTLNGGTKGSSAPTSGTYGSTVTVSNPTRTGYTFNGWTVSGTGASMSGTSLTIGAGNITLTAKWTANTYTISYTLNGGTKGTNAPTSGTYGSTVTIDNPTRTGYTFAGWTVSGTGASMSGTSLTIGAGNITLTANWEISDTTAPTCTLSASAGSTTITAKASDTGGSGVAGKGFSTSYGGETTKKVSATGTIKYYVKDGAGNTGSCSATISATTENCECGAGFPQSGACYIGVIVDGKWTGNKYYKECDYSYSCSSGTKLSNNYCFTTN